MVVELLLYGLYEFLHGRDEFVLQVVQCLVVCSIDYISDLMAFTCLLMCGECSLWPGEGQQGEEQGKQLHGGVSELKTDWRTMSDS